MSNLEQFIKEKGCFKMGCNPMRESEYLAFLRDYKPKRGLLIYLAIRNATGEILRVKAIKFDEKIR